MKNEELILEQEEQECELLGVKMSFKEFDFLMCEQAKGKELKVVDGNVIAEYHIPTEEELNEQRRYRLKDELAKIKEDIEQVEVFRMVRDDYEEKVLRGAKIIQELQVLEGKTPRPIKTE